MSERFSSRLRLATRTAHTRAEQTVFIRGFLRGATNRESYIRLLASLLPVYQAMETALETATHPQVVRFQFRELYRTESLLRDLQFLKGAEVGPLPATAPYVARIREVAETEPLRLIGHVYTRYLGDLSGGMVLARIVERTLGLHRGAGLDFYHFEGVDDIPATKTRFRSRLDELALASDGGNAVIAEANLAFQYNIAMFEQLQGSGLRGLLKNLPRPWNVGRL